MSDVLKKLLPCPFCGSDDIHTTSGRGTGFRQYHCNSCHAKGPVVDAVYDGDKSWNTRAQSDLTAQLTPPKDAGEEMEDLKRQLRLAQHNFEHYYSRYMDETGKTPAECEAEWEKTNPILYGFPERSPHGGLDVEDAFWTDKIKALWAEHIPSGYDDVLELIIGKFSQNVPASENALAIIKTAIAAHNAVPKRRRADPSAIIQISLSDANEIEQALAQANRKGGV